MKLRCFYRYMEKILFARLNEALYTALTRYNFDESNLFMHTIGKDIPISDATDIRIFKRNGEQLPTGLKINDLMTHELKKIYGNRIELANSRNLRKVKLKHSSLK